MLRLAVDADPTPRRVARRIPTHAISGVLCCVYRAAHVEHVVALAGDAEAAGLAPRLWALEAIAPALDRWTVGCGPGPRQALLNRLTPAAPDGWVVFTDDDVVVGDGALLRLLSVASEIGLDVVQPAHAGASRASTPFVRARFGVAARRTGFVEIGPLIALGPAARSALLPLDESLGMGWGQDYLWAHAFADNGLTVGIVDAVRIRHLAPSVPTYDRAKETRHLEACLVRAGYRDFEEPLVTYSTWRVRDLP